MYFRPAFGYPRSNALGKLHPTRAGGAVVLVLGSDSLEVSDETGLKDGRQHRDPVHVTLAAGGGGAHAIEEPRRERIRVADRKPGAGGLVPQRHSTDRRDGRTPFLRLFCSAN